jgi:hypothetical protein
MTFKPLRLAIIYDNARGHCGRIVPRMKALLEERAFLVDTAQVTQGPFDISPYAGLILGTPVLGLGWYGAGPTQAMRDFIEAVPDLGGVRVAIFCVYEVLPGSTLEHMKSLLFDKGAELVVEHACWVLQPHWNEHVIPAECMVRIR